MMWRSPFLWEQISLWGISHCSSGQGPAWSCPKKPGGEPEPVGGRRLLHGSVVDAAQHALHAAPQPAGAAAALNQRELIPH